MADPVVLWFAALALVVGAFGGWMGIVGRRRAAERDRLVRELDELRAVDELSEMFVYGQYWNEVGAHIVDVARRYVDPSVLVASMGVRAGCLYLHAAEGPGAQSAQDVIGVFTEIAKLPAPLSETVALKHEPLYLSRFDELGEPWPTPFPHVRADDAVTVIPLVADRSNTLEGLLVFVAPRPELIDESRLRVLRRLAPVAARGIVLGSVSTFSEFQTRMDSVINTIANFAMSTLDHSRVFDVAAEVIGKAVRGSRVLVWLGTSGRDLRLDHIWLAPAVPAIGSEATHRALAAPAEHDAATLPLRELSSPIEDVRSAIVVPIHVGGGFAGALVVESIELRHWTNGEIRLVEESTRELRVSVETVRAFDARRRESARMAALNRVAAALSGSLDPRLVLDEILRHAVTLYPDAAASLYVWVEEAGVLRCVRDHNRPLRTGVATRRPGEGTVGQAFSTRSTMLVNDYQGWEGAVAEAKEVGTQASLAVPLLRAGNPLGVLVLTSFREDLHFTEEDATLLLLFADQAVSAIVSAEAFEKQQAAVDELERLSKAKSNFISIVSHEFRTPLTGIQGFAEMIRDEELPLPEIKEYAGDIYSDARRLNRMINEMLDLDRMESGRMTLNVESVDLNAIVQDAVARAAPNAPSHPMTTDLADLPTLNGDRDKLLQVMVNLLSNAVKYSPEGGAVEVASLREPGIAHVTVTDHGMGMPEAALEKIFERYSRLETQETRFIQGTGLGLPIVRQIIEMHGGKVWAESVLGQGSTFHVTLPL